MTDPTPGLNLQSLLDLISTAGLQVCESVELAARAPSFSPLPDAVTANVRKRVADFAPNGLYSHQAVSIGLALAGKDVCLATPTASGKSLVFMVSAAELLAREPQARVLALYPAKALIQDQLEKWTKFAEPLGLKVGFIDGSVPSDQRAEILARCHVVAATPDVIHAWLMSHLNLMEVRRFLSGLRLLVLDEAHVYDGAFGTNMAYLMRRLTRASAPFRLIASTATVGEPEQFLRQLTGRDVVVVGAEQDGSELHSKMLLVAKSANKGGFDRQVALLAGLAKLGQARFLAFGDSRKAVERLVGAVLRKPKELDVEAEPDGAEQEEDQDDFKDWPRLEHVLPYRAGYEDDDRREIQSALSSGTLAGVVSTSAMELGLDIGDLDVVVLLGTPPSIKAFRQRIGRAGRRRASVCILIDDQDAMTPLSSYLERPAEPSWLYLQNRYIEYANAICLAAELQASGVKTVAGLVCEGLPETFLRKVENELNPTEAIEPELYAIKQRGQGNPHYEFPIRSAGEPQFKVTGPFNIGLGSLSYGQALREAYPGAVYYYMARPFRIQSLEYKKGSIRASSSRHITTKSLTEIMAFPDFKNGVFKAWRSPDGFVVEVELQVNERVRGFSEQRGSNRSSHEYGPGSPYNQKPISRPFKTTGICWAFPEKIDRSEAAAEAIMKTFANIAGVHERDLGIALFHANEGPFGREPMKGAVVYDSTNGSLRLTERLAEEFPRVVQLAADLDTNDVELATHLRRLVELVDGLVPASAVSGTEVKPLENDWIRLIDREQSALYITGEAPQEVKVLGFRYTPHGVMYELEPLKAPGFTVETTTGKLGPDRAVVQNKPGKWMVLASTIQPLPGTTKMVRYNVVTGEEEPDS